MLMSIATFALAACATPWQNGKFGPDEASAIAKLGQPREVYELPNGSKRLMWHTRPFGEKTTAIDIDADGKISQVRQVLAESEFEQAQIGLWTRHDVLTNFGKPLEIAKFPRMQREVWSYRYRDNDVWYVLYHFHFDSNGTLRSTQQTPDPLHDPDHRNLFRRIF
ncbi:hypothetical protein [Mycoavidus sp. B2-EB]|uniref:hypothetical protein n=1 Tax=Mycoavidus sp. B2-EB TaxID=2651972 RepID=UPI00162669EA|nr:hypothetical protein [Mycoavidus sp. B2-EB]BBO60007.1 lipoprotein [Mycoavidus sp. B2-EB]